MTLHINLYAGPGVGKTVTAALLFAALSLKGVHAELVREYAKELTYMGTIHDTSQDEILDEQHARQALFHGHASVVITDAPLSLALIYSEASAHDEIHSKIQELSGDWDSLHILLHRDLDAGYQTAGRYQNVEQAKSFHGDVATPFFRKYYEGQLIEHNLTNGVDSLVELILARLEKLQ